MDFDRLADDPPPRYAFESDEEEDEFNPLNPNSANSTLLPVNILGDVSKGKKLIIATGEAGKYWAQGASLGEQIGSVQANDVEAGLIFDPTWTSAIVIVSEVLMQLPVWAQYTYALSLVMYLKPTSLVLLDTYSAPTYAISKPISIHDAPIRYLTTMPRFDLTTGAEAKPFSPPNLIQSTSASFMSVLSTSSPTRATLILLPSSRVPRPPPGKILPPDFPRLSVYEDQWPRSVMLKIQFILSAAIEEASHPEWELKGAKERKEGQDNSTEKKLRTSDDVGGMYI